MKHYSVVLLIMVLLIACSESPAPQPTPQEPKPEAPTAPEVENQSPTVVLEASDTSGETSFEVLFTAQATDPEGAALQYVWRVEGQSSIAGARARTYLFDQEGTYRVSVTVSDGELEASDSIEITARDDYRPAEAPDVAIIGIAGRCGSALKCLAPTDNKAYLDDLQDANGPETLQALERTFQALGYSTTAFSFRSNLYSDEVLGDGYLAADLTLDYIRDEWIRDYENPTRVVLVAHSHGNQFMSLLAGDHPEIQFAYGIYLDAVCSFWDSDHVKSGMFDAAFGGIAGYPAPLNRVTYACDSLYVSGVGMQDISDVVPWNITYGLEVRSGGVAWSGLVADDDPNHRPDGTSGESYGIAGVYEPDEGHNIIHVDGSVGLGWVLNAILLNDLPPLGITAQSRHASAFVAPPAPEGFLAD